MQAKSSAPAQTKIQVSLVLLAASAVSLISFSPNAVAQPIDTNSHQNSQTAKEQITSSTQPQACRLIRSKWFC